MALNLRFPFSNKSNISVYEDKILLEKIKCVVSIKFLKEQF